MWHHLVVLPTKPKEVPDLLEHLHYPPHTVLVLGDLGVQQDPGPEPDWSEGNLVIDKALILKASTSYKNINKVKRCIARYSPRATTTDRPTNRAPNKPAWPGPN